MTDARLQNASELTDCVRLFSAMYSYPGYEMSVEEARTRLAAMQRGAWEITEMRDDRGLLAFALWADLDEYIFLRSFAVDAAHRTGGLGRVFLHRLRDEIWPRGRQVRLEVSSGGPQGFWEKLGFNPMTTGMWLEAGEVA